MKIAQQQTYSDTFPGQMASLRGSVPSSLPGSPVSGTPSHTPINIPNCERRTRTTIDLKQESKQEAERIDFPSLPGEVRSKFRSLKKIGDLNQPEYGRPMYSMDDLMRENSRELSKDSLASLETSDSSLDPSVGTRGSSALEHQPWVETSGSMFYNSHTNRASNNKTCLNCKCVYGCNKAHGTNGRQFCS